MMPSIQLNLVVIRSQNIKQSVAFYQHLGLSFEKQKHGKGLEHFASEVNGVTFEIYPCTPKTLPTTSTRLGFRVSSVDTIIDKFQKHGASIISPAEDSEWGRRAIIADPDGHRVELIQL
jgi:lactoylglutathione lyase